MNSEEYYIERDNILKKINIICEMMDNDSKNNINQITHELIYCLNKWRKKNNLPLYKEE